MTSDAHDDVVVWAPRGRDGELAVRLIERHGLRATIVESVEALIARICDAGCAVVNAEVLTPPVREALAAALAMQPPWSDFPIVLVGPRGLDRADHALAAVQRLGNVSILERPVRGATMISALLAALRGRRRQYEARDAIQRRDQFLAMLGHELRNPLAAIMLAVETLPKGDGARQRAILERQSRHLARLVDDLLDVARVTSGKIQLRTEPLDLTDLVSRCVQGAELAADARGIELRTHLASEPLPIDGDQIRIEEVFNNLIANALKYSPSGSRITVTTRRDGGRCIAEVTDTGVGISPDMIDRVFELFAQVNTSLDRSLGGLGIGLTLVRSLVELHGGTVRASSPGLGCGSTFVVELPAATRAARPAPPRLASVPEATRRRVLLVEDNEDLLDMTRELLEGMSCEVATALDGRAGLEQLIARDPDVAFIDIGLPSMDGYAVATEARARGVTTFLIAMTGYGQPGDQKRGHAAGFDLHLTKPVSVQGLRDALAAATRRRPRVTVAR
jgi:signal transduction histidine kinase/CheY-like chemotaxis protein